MNGIWGSFSTADQARMRDALGVQQLPDPSQLTDAQLRSLDAVFGYSISLQILAYDALDDLTGIGEGDAADPRLPDPQLNDASDLAMALGVLQEKLGKLQLGTAQEGVKISKQKVARLSEERLGKIKETLGKMEQAGATGQIGKILGWVGAITGLVVSLAVFAASVVLAAVTGVGVMAAVAAGVGVGIALAGLGMMILQETGAMEKIMDFAAQKPMSTIALIALFGVPVGVVLGILDANGVLKEDQVKMALQVGITANMLALSIASMVLSAGASAGGGGAAMVSLLGKVFGDGAKLVAEGVSNTAKLVSIGTQIFSAGVAISGGAVSIAGAAQNYDVANSQAESKEFLAWLQKIQAQLNDEQEQLKKALEALQSDTAMAAEMLGSIHKSKEAVIGRLGTA